jgi:hypothetical protein
MADAIEANYIPDGDDWTITITGRGRTLTAKAPGIIAARDRTDQLAEELAPDDEYRTVVHLLNGDAVEFTTAYLTARMTRSEPVEPEPAPAEEPSPAAAVRKPPSPRAAEGDTPAPVPAADSEAEPAATPAAGEVSRLS